MNSEEHSFFLTFPRINFSLRTSTCANPSCRVVKIVVLLQITRELLGLLLVPVTKCMFLASCATLTTFTSFPRSSTDAVVFSFRKRNKLQTSTKMGNSGSTSGGCSSCCDERSKVKGTKPPKAQAGTNARQTEAWEKTQLYNPDEDTTASGKKRPGFGISMAPANKEKAPMGMTQYYRQDDAADDYNPATDVDGNNEQLLSEAPQ
ncbi:unnamed protein product [Amoebophrya sp. A25]|nr:unnamed protein product [Amoebophrya sp. A25]|eukprot:GSA25T00011493001.1